MKEKQRSEILRSLMDLAAEEDELLSDLAGIFASILKEQAPSAGCLAVREVIEKISTATEQLISNRQSSARVVETLLKIDVRLSEKKAISAPFAARLAPLAIERALHAEKVRWSEEREMDLARRSPVFRLDERTVFAVPVGLSTDDGLSAFSDRILVEALKKRSKRVVLVLSGLDPQSARHPVWDAVASDLKSQKVRLERIGG
jgi:hypothetical protein